MGRKTEMDIGQNRRIERKRERRGFEGKTEKGYGSKWENKEKEGTEWIWGRRQEWIWVKIGE